MVFANYKISRIQWSMMSLSRSFCEIEHFANDARMTYFRKVVTGASICSTLLNVRHPAGAISIPVIKIPEVIKIYTQ